MPTVEFNKATWDGRYNWCDGGDEWSALWGGSFAQWYGTLYPRIGSHVPANRILEIACGHGRWTHYLKDLCRHLAVVDLSEECIEACKERFSGHSHIEYHVNDGRSLDMIADDSVDFVFTFDSLVHADDLVIEAYLSQLPRVLTKDGVAFLHHSNLGEYAATYARIRRIPKLEGLLARLGLLDRHLHLRDFSVDAKKVEALAEKHGLRCIAQEIVPWETKRMLIDCMSTMVRSDSSHSRPNRVWRNKRFMEEAENLLQISRLYLPAKK